MRLHNSTISRAAPLRYPNGIRLEPPVPLTPFGLFQMTGKFSSLEPVNFVNIL